MAPVPSFPVKVGHIDDVQELKKNKPTSIPERFVRDMIERPKLGTVTTPSSCNLNIPVVDLSKIMNSQDEIMKLSTSCEEWGFFQVYNLSLQHSDYKFLNYGLLILVYHSLL